MLQKKLYGSLYRVLVILLLVSSVAFSNDLKYKNESGVIYIVTTKDTTVGEVNALYYKQTNLTSNYIVKECIINKENAELISGYAFIKDDDLELFVESNKGLLQFLLIENGDTTEMPQILEQKAYSLTFHEFMLPLIINFNEEKFDIKLFNDSPAIITRVPKLIIHDMIIENKGNEVIKTTQSEYLCHKIILKADGFLASKIVPKFQYWYDTKTKDLIKLQVKGSYKIIDE